MPNIDNKHNEQTTDILGKLPPWIVRWGMLVIFIIFALLIIGCYLMKFPQVVTAPIVITTINPPATLITKMSGRIDSIFVADGDTVTENKTIAMIQNSSRYDDVQRVKNLCDVFNIDSINEWIDEDVSMGELQNSYSEFKQQFKSYRHYIESDNIAKKVALLENQITKYKQYISQNKKQRRYHDDDYNITVKNFKRDSLLYLQQAITLVEYEKAKQTKIQKEASIDSYEASLTNMELSLLQMEGQLLELSMQYNNEIASYTTQIEESIKRLSAQIKQWEQTYLLISPIAGRLSYVKYWSRNQNITIGEQLATITPIDSSSVIGIMEVPSAGFGKVKIGQTVNVKLNGYPYFEYGILKGKIERISSIPDKAGYIVEVWFADGMQSTYREHLTLIQQMDGIGEIITVDQRLILRFINPLRAFFDKVSN